LYIVSPVYLNTDFLALPPLTKRPWLLFFIHWIAWILLYFITYIPTLLNTSRISWEFIVFTYVVMASVNFLLFYLVAFYLLPRIGIKEKRWIWLSAICIVLAVVVTFAKFRLENLRTERLMQKMSVSTVASNRPKPVKPSLGFFSYRFRTYLQVNISNTLAIIFIAFAYRLMAAWYLQEKIRKELENQKLQAELSFLKLQVNPHFLFNALNNIYSLAVIEHSRKTGDSIMKLSELMRYVLYEKEDEENKVSLDKEIRHINSYIDLEKLRHEGDIYINFSIEGDTLGKRIAPLLLFPLIENACKHGILTDPAKPVNIVLKLSEHQLQFYIENYVNTYLKDKVGGIGIQNVRKRLELLYDKSHVLDVKKSGEKFIVNLLLPL
jgi:two-component system, LytTR family, sensor kinase